MRQKEFGVIVYGASGFTGQLVAEYLSDQYGSGELRWAMAGAADFVRNRQSNSAKQNS